MFSTPINTSSVKAFRNSLMGGKVVASIMERLWEWKVLESLGMGCGVLALYALV